MSDTTKHTPGPWTWFARLLNDGTPTKEANRSGAHMKFIMAERGQGLAHTVGLSEPADTANADLIAAAPDLLESLKQLADAVREDRVQSRHVWNAECAVARAEGREVGAASP